MFIDLLTTARYTQAYAAGSLAGLLYSIAERIEADLNSPHLADRVRRIYSDQANHGCEAARACAIYDAGWTAGYLNAVETFDRPMSGEQIADCLATASRSLARLAA